LNGRVPGRIIQAMAQTTEGRLNGRMLIAMPGMGDPRFERTVIYMCSHGEDGAMGLVVNRPAAGVSFADLLRQLDIETGPQSQSSGLRFGGPVEVGRGFVLHSSDFHARDGTMRVDDHVSLTSTLDVLRAMAEGRGPRRTLVALGYAGWAPNQLEDELRRNGWLICDADEDLLFSTDDEAKWARALAKLGVSPLSLSATGGTA
jgi:putative transcriptional regulator